MGQSIATKDSETKTAAFVLGENALLLDENEEPLPPGAGVPGKLAVCGVLPLGYYKDPEKTAKTIKTVNGKRYSIPGDYAIVGADGRLTVLGRGSNCINTAGEKVFPEEVEEALKTHATVEDALVLGVPDEQWGLAVTGLVQLAPGASFDEAALRAHVRDRLAGYKTPKRVLVSGVALRAHEPVDDALLPVHAASAGRLHEMHHGDVGIARHAQVLAIPTRAPCTAEGGIGDAGNIDAIWRRRAEG